MAEHKRIRLLMTMSRITFVNPATTIFVTILPYLLGIKTSINVNKYIFLMLITDNMKYIRQSFCMLHVRLIISQCISVRLGKKDISLKLNDCHI